MAERSQRVFAPAMPIHFRYRPAIVLCNASTVFSRTSRDAMMMLFLVLSRKHLESMDTVVGDQGE